MPNLFNYTPVRNFTKRDYTDKGRVEVFGAQNIFGVLKNHYPAVPTISFVDEKKNIVLCVRFSTDVDRNATRLITDHHLFTIVTMPVSIVAGRFFGGGVVVIIIYYRK